VSSSSPAAISQLTTGFVFNFGLSRALYWAALRSHLGDACKAVTDCIEKRLDVRRCAKKRWELDRLDA
jgi:hypothetical protein